MDFLTFGYAEAEARSKTRDRMTEFATRLGAILGTDVGITQVPSYERVAQLAARGEIDLAWLSPIPLVSLARTKRVVPLVALQRDRLTHYRCAFVVPASSRVSTLDGLRGKRVAWVDRHSAAGFVVPRVELDSRGVDLRTLGVQRFYGSHEAVVRAVASGRADFGATWARIQGDKVLGPWTRTPGLSSSVRVLSIFGEVPPDAFAARYDMDRHARDALVRGLLTMTQDPGDREILRDIFGAEDMEVPRKSLYEPLRNLVIDAKDRGLLDVRAATDDELLNAAATVEQRAAPGDVPTARTLPDAEEVATTRRRGSRHE